MITSLCGFRDFFTDVLFAIGEHFHCLPNEVGKKRLGWLLPTYRRVLKSRWDAQITQVQATELGTARAIAQAFSSKRVSLPELPTFERMLRDKLPAGARMPSWMKRFEEVNK